MTVDGLDSGSEDELFFAEKDWSKMHQRSMTTGYREGMEKASEEGLHAGFDRAYTEGFKTGIDIGVVRGKIAAKKFINVDNMNNSAILDELEHELNVLEKSDSDNQVLQMKIKDLVSKLNSI